MSGTVGAGEGGGAEAHVADYAPRCPPLAPEGPRWPPMAPLPPSPQPTQTVKARSLTVTTKTIIQRVFPAKKVKVENL